MRPHLNFHAHGALSLSSLWNNSQAPCRAFTTLYSSPNLSITSHCIRIGAFRGTSRDFSVLYTPLLLFLHGISICLRILIAHFVPSKADMQPASPFCFLRVEKATHKPLNFHPLASYHRPWHVVSVSCNCACIPHTRRQNWYMGLCISVQFNASSPAKNGIWVRKTWVWIPLY